MPDPAHIHTVTQLTRRIRTLLEIQVGEVWVEGEVSNCRPNKSGHVYFTLKDSNAQLACVLWRSTAARLRLDLRDGLQVQAFGEISVYEAQGKYQLVVARVQEKGVGALQARFEELKRRLEAEGLFAAGRKRPIPAFPRTIALVTSPTGAAIRDLLTVLGRRAPWIHILVVPVPVQGRGAEDEIAAAIGWLNQQSGNTLPAIDTMIVGRGGGSIEDLWCFNEEVVARAIAASAIPVVSAVGHEIDFTIADFVADLRAATPSAAAELVAPDGVELRRRLGLLYRRLSGGTAARIGSHARLLAAWSRESLGRAPRFALREARQRLDTIGSDLEAAVLARTDTAGRVLAQAGAVLAAARPEVVLAHAARRLGETRVRLALLTSHCLQRHGDRCQALGAVLRSLGPQAVLERGFSLTFGADGRPLRSVAAVRSGDFLTTRLADGEVASRVYGLGRWTFAKKRIARKAIGGDDRRNG